MVASARRPRTRARVPMGANDNTAEVTSTGKATDIRSRKCVFYWGIAGAILVVLLALPLVCVYQMLPKVEDMREPASAKERDEWFAQIREVAGIAELPPSATGLRIGRSGWSAGRVFILRFNASPAEIEAFLATSPVLRGSTPISYSAAYPLTPDLAAAGDVLSGHPDWPSWFDPWLRKAGRMYRPEHSTDNTSYELSWIIVNDETHVVYAYMTWGQ